MDLDDDDEYGPTVEDIAVEEAMEPVMMHNAKRWDNFLELVLELQREWAEGELDTDDYRKQRALRCFLAGSKVAVDLIELKPTMKSWVPHILCNIVPRQMLRLGCPARRSCDACESLGAKIKKIIKHSTCRRRIFHGSKHTHAHHGVTAGNPGTRSVGNKAVWKQTFTRHHIMYMMTHAQILTHTHTL